MSKKKQEAPELAIEFTLAQSTEVPEPGPNTVVFDPPVPVPYLTGDTTDEDWKNVLGLSWEEYVQPIREKYVRHPNYDRNDMFRPHFNRMAPLGDRTQKMVEDFYTCDFWCRLLAFECPRDGLLKNIIDQYTEPQSQAEAPLTGLEMALRGVDTSKTPFKVLDHGCGRGEFTLAALWLHPDLHFVCCDFATPARVVLANSIAKYMPWANVTFCWKGQQDYRDFGPFDYINSSEVLEHCWDPELEASYLWEAARHDALMHLSTFFNDCGGHNPSHLREHHQFQDVALWLGRLKNLGWKVAGHDPRGIAKIFRKT